MTHNKEQISPSVEAGVQKAWEIPVVCRVEVDLPAWMEELTGEPNWELLNEEQDETYMSFAMQHGQKKAEITLYHSGYAVVDLDGLQLFDGSLTTSMGEYAHLAYYNAESGEPITLN